jgi:hypothetical protein
MSAEQLKIWNSPTMLRARAWVQEYCQRSAKITPEQAAEYMQELERLTPTQMKLWLLKFQEQEEMIQRQQAAFEKSRQADVQGALAAEQRTRQAYANINRDESAAAGAAEQSLAETRQTATDRELQNDADSDAAATALTTEPVYPSGYGLYGYYGGYPAAAVNHYHFHYHGK